MSSNLYKGIEEKLKKDLEGTKYDQGKVRMDLLPPEALEEIAWIMTFGANKYGDHNWRAGIKYSRVFGALLRHLYAWWRGENLDPESGRTHLAHAGCCILFLITYEKHNKQFDDRYINATPQAESVPENN